MLSRVKMLREMDRQYGPIKFVDISSDEYNAKENQGLDYKNGAHFCLAIGFVYVFVLNISTICMQTCAAELYANYSSMKAEDAERDKARTQMEALWNELVNVRR